MSANVETMFSANREKPWHYEMTKEHTKLVQEALTSEDALHAAGLDWEVIQKPMFMKKEIETNDGGIDIEEIEVPNYKANVRNSDGSVLGIVSDHYRIVQNTEAFEFTDALVGETEDGVVKYETAGSLNGGRRIWLLAKMPTQKVLDDDIDPYMVFTNSHDGTGAIKVAMTPIRVVCNNTLNMALNTAKRAWSAKHMGDMDSKLEEAKNCLRMSNKYMKGLEENADRLANEPLYKEQFDEILNELFPVDDKMTDRKKNNIAELKNDIQVCYMMPDILKFGESKWRAINAMSDFVTHSAPKRNTSTFEEKRWGRIMDGDIMFDNFVNLVQKVAVK